ncbi:MAG TPA: ABC transporter ATP-binding protein [Acidimicrobiales bacterium]|nr:ABC transporter ATP-binding protein [Acidimicrobiales bacterium]
MTQLAIEVDDVAKRFRIVHSRNRTLKATVFNGFRRTEYEEFWALDGVSFDVPEGSTFGLIGHNGSGKSTLLKCLARIYHPDRGTIRTNGIVSALLELGAGFHPELSGRENVYLNASILGLSRRDVDARFDDIVDFAGLGQFIDSPVKNYSSGMFVRLGFAVAINVEPDVLLVDEVLAVGDEAFQQRCLAKFADLRASGRTIVIVSHGLDAVRNLCDRAGLLDHGKLVGHGRAADVVDQYLDAVRGAREGAPVSTRTGADGWEIGDVAVLGPEQKPVDEVTSGKAVAFRVSFSVGRPGDVVVELDLHRNDGVHVAGPRHRFTAIESRSHDMVLTVPNLPVVAGAYDVSVRLMDGSDVERAVGRRLAHFDVIDNRSDYFGGVISLHGAWSDADREDA